jgi:translocation and assembly module TamB
MRRFGKWVGWIAAIVITLPIALILLVLVVANTGPGQRLIAGMVPGLTGHTIELQGLSGRVPDRLRVSRLALTDANGAYLTLEGVALDWSPLRLLHGEFNVARLEVQSAEFLRQPLPSNAKSGSSTLPVRVVLQEFRVGRLTIAPAVAGKAAGQAFVVAVHGTGTLESYTAGRAALVVQRLNGPGQYSVDAAVDPGQIRAKVLVDEPPGGLIAGLAGLPAIGALKLDASLDGPRNAVATRVALSAGPMRVSAQGTLDLVHNAAVLTVNATAPAMTPRPDVTWQSVALDAHVQGPFTAPDVTGHVELAGLLAFGTGVASLNADAAGNAGQVRLQAAIGGLTLPGQDPSLFAGAPVLIDATAQLAAAGRPIEFSLRHPLINAHGTARTAGPLQADVSLNLPQLGPVAKLGGPNLEGQSTLHLHVAQQAATTAIALNGTLGVTGGLPQAAALLGSAAHIDLAATLTGHDAVLQRLQVTGQRVAVAAHGGLVNNVADLHWTIHLADLAAVAPMLLGQLDAQGQVSGPETDLTASVDLSGHVSAPGLPSGPISVKVRAAGLPYTPRGTLMADGALLGAPVNLALAVRQQNGGFHIALERAGWKSLNAEGDLTLPKGATVPIGQLHLAMPQLADLQPLLGRPIGGSINASVQATNAAAKIALTVQRASLPGTASIGSATLAATITSPQHDPAVDGTLAVQQIEAGSISGSARLTARGPTNALALTLAADAPSLSGAPARINAAATLDATARRLSVASFTANWRQEPVRLLAPVQIDFANGLAIDRLQVGLRQGVLEVQGRASPTLDLTANLRNLPASLASVAAPSLHASGTIAANAHLTGTTAKPQGTIELTASRVRLSSGPGAAMPPADLTANAVLSGQSAHIDTRLTLGAALLTVAGTAPVGAGAMDLTANLRNLPASLASVAVPSLHASGTIAANARLTGTPARPEGTIRLTASRVRLSTGPGAAMPPADLTANAVLNGRSARLDTRLTLGAALLTVAGTAPLGAGAMDLTANLRNLPASLASVANPSLHASGTITANARLTGTTARPQGTIRLIASRVRLSTGPGAAMPPADLIANAVLNGQSARIDTRLTAGAAHLSVAGTVPLGAGALDLRTAGQLDLAMLDPVLAAEGRRVRGILTLDATIRGTTAAPLVTGTARLAQGGADDFTQGMHVSSIAAELRADGQRMQLVQFSGRAGPGTLSGSGTIDLRPPMPVHLVFVTSNAEPIASDIVTARLDSRITIAGQLAGTVSVDGTVNVRQANVQVPEKLPSSVVTLPVRFAGAPPAPKPTAAQAAPTNIALHITVNAPQQVFVRGRGLDVELGGRIAVGGTATTPQLTGGLHLRYGTLSVIGQTLTFTSGTIDFTGASLSNPSINLVATATTGTTVATLTVSGTAQDPKITLSSVPPLPQDEILAALLFHERTSNLSPFQIAELGSALASLSGATSGVGDPLGDIRKSLGLDRLSVGSSPNGSPTLQAGRYVARGVYVGAQQSATGNGTQAVVQIDLAKGLRLQTTAGTGSTTATGAASGGDSASVGITYQFEY